MLRVRNYFAIFTAVFYKPEKAFRLAAGHEEGARKLFYYYGLPLLVVASTGRMMAHTAGAGDWLASLTVFLINFCAYSVAIFLGAYLVSRLAVPFRSISDRSLTLKLIVIAFTPFLVSQPLTAISTGMRVLGFLALAYTFVLFGVGLKPMLQTPPSKASGYSLVAFFILLGIAWVVNLVLSGLFIIVF